MSEFWVPRKCQTIAVDHLLKLPESGLFLDMGLGKTASTLTAIRILMYDRFEISKVLIIAPTRVAHTVWDAEIKKWQHLNGLTFSKVLGLERERKAALKATADIYIINRENVVWLINYFGGFWPFDMLVIDELSSFKSAEAKRFKALRMVRPRIKRVTGLTGTPAPNSLLDLWAPLYLLDQGQRLGNSQTAFKEAYFTPKHNNSGYFGGYEIRPDIDKHDGPSSCEREIYGRISDICLSMKTADYSDLPDRIEQIEYVELLPETLQRYKDFERDTVLELLEHNEIINAVNAGALNTKLQQFANGAVYRENGEYYEVHSEKTAALLEMVEAANGKPVMVFYWFKHDYERLCKILMAYSPRTIRTGNKGMIDVDDWNAGKIAVLLIHGMSAGHGLNLQFGSNLCFWFSLTWSSEIYQQGVKRVHREGQKEIVINKRFVVRGTIDEKIIKTVDGKMKGEAQLMDALSYAKSLIKKYQDLKNLKLV